MLSTDGSNINEYVNWYSIFFSDFLHFDVELTKQYRYILVNFWWLLCQTWVMMIFIWSQFGIISVVLEMDSTVHLSNHNSLGTVCTKPLCQKVIMIAITLKVHFMVLTCYFYIFPNAYFLVISILFKSTKVIRTFSVCSYNEKVLLMCAVTWFCKIAFFSIIQLVE